MMRHPALHCKGCGRRPDEIREYVIEAQQYAMTPDQFVRADEGTYNPDDGSFICTECYFKAHQQGVTT